MKARILQLLREQEGYVSGQDICRKLSVSRTAVWKVIGQLKEEGYVIEAVQNKGYRLLEVPDLVTEGEVASRLHTGWAGHPTVFLERTDSTNNEAKRMAEAGASHGTLVVAENQEAGKGRRGRSWSSPEKSGIWMTLIMKPEFPPSQASMLTLVAAMAVAEGVRSVTGLEAGIKWPNDIVVNGKKICGILTEMSAEPDYINHVVVGIGINANMEEFPPDIREKATSLSLELGEKVSRAAVIAEVWNAFELYYDKFLENADLSSLREKYEAHLLNRGKEVCVLDPKGEWRGVARGIDRNGRLLIEQTGSGDEGLRAVDSGEVSVRGVYGYV
ncbi:biotin--[acetyl-CoA-carboxylase] ligase [Qiania dongpingensis]|uniref:Bifunctional ligase/repressor BirA n=1 Tax=Qiania dongpingensis TaxID=2763669 RepID=A0A7G9G7W1_9FIRM|nr:biotin--[acetyl-CoA-carboxylase] ligase [Qiania dongpingensis]QNM06893.1 biotin--[acetyl-CoA-carboxylase] ligase [Qiania dongpingensis]